MFTTDCISLVGTTIVGYTIDLSLVSLPPVLPKAGISKKLVWGNNPRK